MKKLYHIINQSELDNILKNKLYTPDSLNTEGFVHLAYYHQLETILSQFFPEATGICLLEIDPTKLDFDVKDEAPVGIENDGNLYPHLYGPIQTKALCSVYKLIISSTGQFQTENVVDCS
ncbi:DUF952 domain-containing protein [Vibrio sp. 99-8-1]|uniref:DUF952 domain-containing protein n=1 Tax=Vibrio sp. 99-8-1 TaxID=2607602 RepID=UPI001493C71E|nr:DUF952 domain-containing protein [Vibrio sp. 99-8-1]NOI68597.1 DUF952 domain-containing protein [Vibrio sp. 99-8-1]